MLGAPDILPHLKPIKGCEVSRLLSSCILFDILAPGVWPEEVDRGGVLIRERDKPQPRVLVVSPVATIKRPWNATMADGTCDDNYTSSSASDFGDYYMSLSIVGDIFFFVWSSIGSGWYCTRGKNKNHIRTTGRKNVCSFTVWMNRVIWKEKSIF